MACLLLCKVVSGWHYFGEMFWEDGRRPWIDNMNSRGLIWVWGMRISVWGLGWFGMLLGYRRRCTLRRAGGKYIILGILPALEDTIGSNTYQSIAGVNAVSKTSYPNNYVDITPPTLQEMQLVGYAPDSTDAADIQRGVFPRGLRYDGIHLRSKGYHIIANRIYNKMEELGYW